MRGSKEKLLIFLVAKDADRRRRESVRNDNAGDAERSEFARELENTAILSYFSGEISAWSVCVGMSVAL